MPPDRLRPPASEPPRRGDLWRRPAAGHGRCGTEAAETRGFRRVEESGARLGWPRASASLPPRSRGPLPGHEPARLQPRPGRARRDHALDRRGGGRRLGAAGGWGWRESDAPIRPRPGREGVPPPAARQRPASPRSGAAPGRRRPTTTAAPSPKPVDRVGRLRPDRDESRGDGRWHGNWGADRGGAGACDEAQTFLHDRTLSPRHPHFPPRKGGNCIP